jgi:dolichol kinase
MHESFPQLKRPKPEWRRLFFHVGSCSLAAVLCRYIEDPYWRGGLTILALIGTLIYEYFVKGRDNWLGRQMQAILRRKEHRTRSAGTDFIIAMSICAFAFDEKIVCAAFLVTAWADPAARLFGTYLTALPRIDRRKTIEGSIGFLGIAWLVLTLSMLPETWQVTAPAAVAGMIAELPRQRTMKTWFGSILTPADNFWIPIVVSTVLTALIKLR